MSTDIKLKIKDSTSKDNIIRIAFTLFLEKGYKEVTIKDIMAATNLSKGAIYHHFNSKEEIYHATLEAHYFDLIKMDQLEFDGEDFRNNVECLYNYVTKLFTGIENLRTDGLSYPIRSFFVYQLKSEHNETIRNQKILSVIEFRKKVRQIVNQGLENGEIRNDLRAEEVTSHIISFIEGLAIHHSTIKNNVKEELNKNYRLVFDSYLKLICD